jgi:hypothetical protein
VDERSGQDPASRSGGGTREAVRSGVGQERLTVLVDLDPQDVDVAVGGGWAVGHVSSSLVEGRVSARDVLAVGKRRAAAVR